MRKLLSSQSILGCCGYYQAQTLEEVITSSVVLCDSEEEVAAYFKACDHNDSLISDKEDHGVRFSFKVPGQEIWIASYVLPTRQPALDTKALQMVPKTLHKSTHGWGVRGGTASAKSMLKQMLDSTTHFYANELPVTPIQGFADNTEYFTRRFNEAMALANTKVFGLTFMNRDKGICVEQSKKLHAEYDVLVDVSWHNPRYDREVASHDLRTIFFQRKEVA